MNFEAFYGQEYFKLRTAENTLLQRIRNQWEELPFSEEQQVIQHISSRIKSPESMQEKLRRYGFPPTRDAALHQVYDALGIRIICSFSDQIFQLVRWFRCGDEWEILQEKDYVTHPKPNGYRSYHLILRLWPETEQEVAAEVQIRTMAADFWASLEHQMKYKNNIPNEALLCAELKDCADTIASLDLTMQTIRDLISGAEREGGVLL